MSTSRPAGFEDHPIAQRRELVAENAATLDGGDLDASGSGHALGLDQAEQNGERLIAGGGVRAEHAERAPAELRGELR